ncbi:hypothetical protein HZB97_00095 [Candidatus Gottesmanbacteria bacterium]|nr:hypothetical protein [Candidatus Gottesmanbacteria bacterium]
MYNYAPKDYICPLCLVAEGVESKNTETKQADVVYKDKYLTANDRLYENHSLRRFVPAEKRLPYAEKLRNFLNKKRSF